LARRHADATNLPRLFATVQSPVAPFDTAFSVVAILFWEYEIAAGVRRLAGDAVQRTKAARAASGKIDNRVRAVAYWPSPAFGQVKSRLR
jgi:hypothetical protein